MPHRTHRRPSPPPARARKHPQHPGYLDPVLTRKGGATSHPGRIVFAVGGVLFAAYIFNVGGTATYLDGFFRGLDHSAHLYDAEVSRDFLAALPWLGGLAAGVLGLVAWTAVRRGSRTLRKVKRLRKRQEHSLQSFAALAAGHGVSHRVSREAYYLLKPHYRNRMRAVVADHLTHDLRLTPLQVRDLHGNLMRMSDRLHNVREELKEVATILDLMLAVERCEIRSVTESGVRRRSATPAATPAPTPASEHRHRSFIRPARLPRPEPPYPGLPSTGTD